MNGIPTPDGARKGLGAGARVMLLQAATDALGQAAMSDALDIQPRSLRAKLALDRQITDSDLRCAIAAISARSDELARLAASIQDAMS